MAHLLEHMQFKGTPRHPDIKGEFQRHGASFNASTSFDRTNFYETMAASQSNLDWALQLEADRMVNSKVAKKDLDSEMTVVRNEFEAGENSPDNVLGERMAAAAYLWHNYGHAVIGARSDIENVPIARLQAFYHKYYQPDNAVLLISGRFDEAAALGLIERYFGVLPRPARKLIPTYTVEPTQDGERSVTLRRAGEVQLVGALYHLPPGSHADFPAIDILVTALTKVPGGRLQRALVQTGKASAIYGGDEQLREAGYAYFGASLGKDLPLDAARTALIATLQGFAADPITDDEVERARTQLLNEIDMAMTNPRELGIALSDFIGMGDWRLFFLYRDGLRQVKREDVQRVALEYFKTSNRTLGMFVPTPHPDRAEIPPAPDIAALVKDYKGEAAVAAGEAFDPTAANIDARTIGAATARRHEARAAAEENARRHRRGAAHPALGRRAQQNGTQRRLQPRLRHADARHQGAHARAVARRVRPPESQRQRQRQRRVDRNAAPQPARGAAPGRGDSARTGFSRKRIRTAQTLRPDQHRGHEERPRSARRTHARRATSTPTRPSTGCTRRRWKSACAACSR